jgi:hypothetical protein
MLSVTSFGMTSESVDQKLTLGLLVVCQIKERDCFALVEPIKVEYLFG